MWKRKAYITVLALVTATLGWYPFDGIFTIYRADKLCDAIHAEDIEEVAQCSLLCPRSNARLPIRLLLVRLLLQL
jgi:hypothetical protein